MVFSDALEVAIGLTFVYLLVSLAMAAVLEFIETLTKTRGSRLLDGIEELLGDPAVVGSGGRAAAAIYGHPLVQGLFRGQFVGAAADKRLPSYVPARNFALALVDQVLAARVDPAVSVASIPGPQNAPLGERLRLAAERVQNPHLRAALAGAALVGQDDLERVVKHLQDWYDGAMDRVSGRYKRRSQRLLFWLGLVVVVAMNVNTLTLADSLSKNASLRRAVVAQVERHDPAADPAGASLDKVVTQIDRLGLPIGWSRGAVAALEQPLLDDAGRRQFTLLGASQIAIGWLLTALAITLGAPFWFDVLNRLMVIRATVKPKEKSPEEGSEDRKPADKTIALVAQPAQRPAAAPLPALAERPVDRDIYAALPAADEKPFEEWDR